jgi:hypothetical protein
VLAHELAHHVLAHREPSLENEKDANIEAVRILLFWGIPADAVEAMVVVTIVSTDQGCEQLMALADSLPSIFRHRPTTCK